MATQYTHLLNVSLHSGEVVELPTSRPGKTVLEVANELANRLRGEAALWGPVGDDGAVVIPSRAILCLEVSTVYDPGDEAAPDPAPGELYQPPLDAPAAEGGAAAAGAPPVPEPAHATE